MPGELLVGLDGSKFSQSAIDHAIHLVGQSGGSLLGIGIIDTPAIRKGEAVSMGASYFKVEAEHRHLQSAREQIERFQKEFLDRCVVAGVSARTLLTEGDPWEQIATEAQRCDAIVLGMETYYHFETQSAPCETLKLVLKHTPRPVIAVPVSVPQGNNLIVAYDGSLQAARMLGSLWATGLCTRGEVHVIGIHEDRDEASRRIQRAAAFLHSHGISTVAHPIASSHKIVPTLLECAESLRAGLIAIGAYGRSTLHDFFFGSVTKSILQSSRVPVFLFH